MAHAFYNVREDPAHNTDAVIRDREAALGKPIQQRLINLSNPCSISLMIATA